MTNVPLARNDPGVALIIPRYHKNCWTIKFIRPAVARSSLLARKKHYVSQRKIWNSHAIKTKGVGYRASTDIKCLSLRWTNGYRCDFWCVHQNERARENETARERRMGEGRGVGRESEREGSREKSNDNNYRENGISRWVTRRRLYAGGGEWRGRREEGGRWSMLWGRWERRGMIQPDAIPGCIGRSHRKRGLGRG